MFHSDIEIYKNIARVAGQFLDTSFYVPYVKSENRTIQSVHRFYKKMDRKQYGNVQLVGQPSRYIEEQVEWRYPEKFSFSISHYEYGGRKHLVYSNWFNQQYQRTDELLIWPELKDGIDPYYAKERDVVSCDILWMSQDFILPILEDYHISLADLYHIARKWRRKWHKPSKQVIGDCHGKSLIMTYHEGERSQAITLDIERDILEKYALAGYHISRQCVQQITVGGIERDKV